MILLSHKTILMNKRCLDSIHKDSIDYYKTQRKKQKTYKIKNVQYGILSENEIRNRSNVEVSETTINKCGNIFKNGVNDNKMGTNLQSVLCATCASDSTKCQGHTGHVKLTFPCINVEFIGLLHKVLTCVCFHCSALLLPRNHPKYYTIKKIKNKKSRLKEVFNICSRNRQCASFGKKKVDSGIDDTLTYCGGHQPHYKKGDILITAKFQNVDKCSVHQFTINKMTHILRYISKENIEMLGMDYEHAHPQSMIWKSFLVPPVQTRPSNAYRITSTSNENELTMSIRNIVKCNNQCKQIKLKDINLTDNNIQNKQFELYVNLQRSIAAYQDNKFSTNIDYSGVGDANVRKGIRDRFTGKKAKKGRMRHTIFGKRQNYSARTVITPCCDMNIDDVGVPKWICMKLTYPERVTIYNIHHLTKSVRNGPKTHPGANFVLDSESDRLISLGHIDCNSIVLKLGDIVNRHLINGDLVLFNRQPSLHKMSMMAHKVKVMSGNSFRLHMAVTKAYNADFDGDEMNIEVLMDEMTKAEALELVSVKKNMVKDAFPIICFQQHAVISAYLLTHPKCIIEQHKGWQLLNSNSFVKIDTIHQASIQIKDRMYFSGIELFSLCIPEGVFINTKSLHVVDGVIKRGRMNKKTLNNELLYTIWQDLGSEIASNFISGMQIFLDNFISTHGVSIGIDDCIINHGDVATETINTANDYISSYTSHSPSNTFRNSEKIESNICLVLDKTRDKIGNKILEDLEKNDSMINNGLYNIVKSGAKGNETNIIQIAGMVGQQMDHNSMRLSDSTTHFNNVNNNSAHKHGMVFNSFMSGLTPVEYFHHLTGSRVGLVDTAVKTSDTGYSQRKVAKAMEDYVVGVDLTVRDSECQIVQYVYGSDGFDSSNIEYNDLRIVHITKSEIISTYVWSNSELKLDVYAQKRMLLQQEETSICEQLELKQLCSIRDTLLYNVNVSFDVNCVAPFKFSRLIDITKFHFKKDIGLNVTPLEVYKTIRSFWDNISKKISIQLSLKFKCLFFDWCSVHTLLIEHKFRKHHLSHFLCNVYKYLSKKSITPYESVGIIASQHCVEPLTQMTLNRFHKSGQFSHLVNGVSRMKEIINGKKVINAPSMRIVLKSFEPLKEFGEELIALYVREFVEKWSVSVPLEYIDRNDIFLNSWKHENSTFVNGIKRHTLFIHVDRCKGLQYNISPRLICKHIIKSCNIKKLGNSDYMMSYSNVYSKNWWICMNIYEGSNLWKLMECKITKQQSCKPNDDYILLYIYEFITYNVLIRGLSGVDDFYIDTCREYKLIANVPKKVMTNVIQTKGSNLIDMLCLYSEDIRVKSVISNDIMEVERVLGIDAAMFAIEHEWKSVMSINDAHVGVRHIKLISEAMCRRGIVCPMNYEGICKEDISTIKKASFEKVMESFISGAFQGSKNNTRTCSDSICWNSKLYAGTGRVVTFSEKIEIPKEIFFKNVKNISKKEITFKCDENVLDTYICKDLNQKENVYESYVDVEKSKQKPIKSKYSLNCFIPSSPKENFSYTNVSLQFIPTSP